MIPHHPTAKDFFNVAEALENILIHQPDANINHLFNEAFQGWSPLAHKISEKLGFKSPYECRNWAIRCSTVWGNKNGKYLFVYSTAFTDADKPHIKNMDDIINHFIEVGMRVYLKELYEIERIDEARHEIRSRIQDNDLFGDLDYQIE